MVWKPRVTVAVIAERHHRFLMVEEDEIRSLSDQMRSPLVLKRYPLDVLVDLQVEESL